MKKIISAILASVMCFTLPVLATENGEASADILYTLDLIEGTDNGYELDKAATRLEMLVFTLRLAGLEDEALASVCSSPFIDVPDWGEAYVSYAYENGLISGIDSENFGSDMAVRDKDFFTMILRVLGYSDDAGDFSWATSSAVAVRLGISEQVYTDFTRGDMFDCALGALTAAVKDEGTTLVDKLTTSGDIDRAKASALGLSGERPLSAREIADRCSPAVGLLECYDSSTSVIDRSPDSNSSAVFISSDGIMVTNYHTIDGSVYATVTLSTGEQYAVESVLFYNADIDAAVIRVSNTAIGTDESTVFPYLDMAATDTVHVGDTVFAIGNPLGLQNSLSSGIVSSKERVLSAFALPMIQNTASISQGSSGGALLNEYGDIIGITSGYFSYGQDLYLSVPIDPIIEADLSGEGYTLKELSKIMADAD